MSVLDGLAGLRDRLDEAIADTWENRRRELGLALGAVALAAAVGFGAYWWMEIRGFSPAKVNACCVILQQPVSASDRKQHR